MVKMSNDSAQDKNKVLIADANPVKTKLLTVLATLGTAGIIALIGGYATTFAKMDTVHHVITRVAVMEAQFTNIESYLKKIDTKIEKLNSSPCYTGRSIQCQQRDNYGIKNN